MRFSLNIQIVIAAAIGITGGFILSVLGPAFGLRNETLYICDLLGNILVGLLKMILIPLIFCTITLGIAHLRVHKKMKRVWQVALIFFLSTPAIASLLGLIAVNVFKPGKGSHINMLSQLASNVHISSLSLSEFGMSFVTGLFMNPFQAVAQGQILPTIVFAIFLGIALIHLGDSRAKTVLSFLKEFLELIMLIIGWVMRFLPIGIAALLLKLVATQNANLLSSMGTFMAVVIGATLFHGFVILPLILFIFTKYHPLAFLKGMKDALITAFSTSSSSATLPVTLRCIEENLKVDKNIAGFVAPLGATVNMDGTALYEAIAAIFVANLVGINLNIIQQIIVFIMAILGSIGAPGIPSAGMVTMVMVLQSVGLPAEAIAILLPIDRILDAFRTMVNVEGDAIGSLIVQRYVGRS